MSPASQVVAMMPTWAKGFARLAAGRRPDDPTPRARQRHLRRSCRSCCRNGHTPVALLLAVNCATLAGLLVVQVVLHKRALDCQPDRSPPSAAASAALEALGKNQEALQAYEKARWLAQAHDNDPQGEQEYEEAVQALKLRMAYHQTDDYGDINNVRL